MLYTREWARQQIEAARTWTPPPSLTDSSLRDALIAAMSAVSRMSEDEYLAMTKAQRESFVRAMTTPCEHGELDFEQCAECRKANHD